MPQYITANDLLATGARRLAQAATPDDAPVIQADVLRRAIAGEDLEVYGYDPDMITAAAEAVAHIETAIDRAEGDLNNAARDRYAMPLDDLDEGTLGLLRDLALAYCWRGQRPADVADALKAGELKLRWISDGSLTLPATRLGTGTAPGSPEFSSTDAVLAPDSMGPGGSGWPGEGW